MGKFDHGWFLNKSLFALMILFYYFFASAFFFTQGKLIDEIIKKDGNSLFYLLAMLAITKFSMMLIDLLQKNLKEYLSILNYKKKMTFYYPSVIYSDMVNYSSYIFDTLNTNLNKQFNSCMQIFTHRFTFFLIMIFYFFYLFYTQFYFGGTIAMIMALSVFFSRLLYGKKLDAQLDCLELKKNELTQWNKEYFDCYKEISIVWREKVADKKWFNELFSAYIKTQLNINQLFFIKNLSGQLLVELPYILLMSALFFGIYTNKISMPQAFVWLGISQFILTTSHDLAKNNELKKILAACDRNIQEVHLLIHPVSEISVKNTTFHPECSYYSFYLHDGSCVELSRNPGIYPIFGKNGVGKTTLLDTIVGFNRQSFYHTHEMFSLTQKMNTSNMRIINRNALFFSLFKNFDAQILGGHGFINPDYRIILIENMGQIFPESVINQWVSLLNTLKVKFNTNKNYRLSLGEQVILSCWRTWGSWSTDVSLLLVDECDSSLDQENQQLFFKTISYLCHYIPVFMVSHHADFNDIKIMSTSFKKALLHQSDSRQF